MTSPHLTYLVLDVLRVLTPSLPEFASFLGELEGVTTVNVTLVEMDEKTESLKVVLEGPQIELDELKKHMEKQSAVIHSIDQVVVEKTSNH